MAINIAENQVLNFFKQSSLSPRYEQEDINALTSLLDNTETELTSEQTGIFLDQFQAMENYIKENSLRLWSQATMNDANTLVDFVSKAFRGINFYLDVDMTDQGYSQLINENDSMGGMYEKERLIFIPLTADSYPWTLKDLEVNMTSPNGVTLATKGKFCDKNVKINPMMETLSATANGTFSPSVGKVGYSSVTVNVPVTEAVPNYTGSYAVTKNGSIACAGMKMTSDLSITVPNKDVFGLDLMDGTASLSLTASDMTIIFKQTNAVITYPDYLSESFEICGLTVSAANFDSASSSFIFVKMDNSSVFLMANGVSIFKPITLESAVFDRTKSEFTLTFRIESATAIIPIDIAFDTTNISSMIVTNPTVSSNENITFDEATKTLSIVNE